jgi:hypothetical protein
VSCFLVGPPLLRGREHVRLYLLPQQVSQPFLCTMHPYCSDVVLHFISHSRLVLSMSKATRPSPRKPPCRTVGPPHRNKLAARGLPKRDARGSSAWSASWALHTSICNRGFFVGPPPPPHCKRRQDLQQGEKKSWALLSPSLSAKAVFPLDWTKLSPLLPPSFLLTRPT